MSASEPMGHQGPPPPTRGPSSTEIIAIASGKGGTGKTLIAACLGYALTYAGHRVLLIDADTATNGLSLFLLGPKGQALRPTSITSTWTAILRSAAGEVSTPWSPAVVRRDLEGQADHGLKYQVLISDLGLYGEDLKSDPVMTLNRGEFSRAANSFFAQLRSANSYDYVLVDTRGGFSFETTDLCALADSFIVVTDADVTSFVQDRNLLMRINAAAGERGKKPLLRAMIVNRATEGDEELFRLALTREFPVTFAQTYPIPLDLDAFKAYKVQQSPYVAAPGSHFAYATLKAFGDIMSIITAQWEDAKVARWNELSGRISKAVEERNARFEKERAEKQKQQEESATLKRQLAERGEKIEQLERELQRSEAAHEREIKRVEALRSSVPADVAVPSGRLAATIARYRWALRALMVLAAVSFPLLTYQTYVSLRAEKDSDMLVKLYQRESPAPQRGMYLKELYGKAFRSFDNIDLGGVDLRGLKAPGISLRAAKLPAVDLAGADLTRADLSSANASGADLSWAALTQANLTNTILIGANLSHADLRGATLDGTNLDKARLSDALADPGSPLALLIDKQSAGNTLPNPSPPSNVSPPAEPVTEPVRSATATPSLHGTVVSVNQRFRSFVVRGTTDWTFSTTSRTAYSHGELKGSWRVVQVGALVTVAYSEVGTQKVASRVTVLLENSQ